MTGIHEGGSWRDSTAGIFQISHIIHQQFKKEVCQCKTNQSKSYQ